MEDDGFCRPPHSEKIDAALAAGQELVRWINTKLHGRELKGDHRHRIPAQLFDMAIEHHASILILLGCSFFASAFALVRCEFEFFVRGAWLHYCATDAEIEAFIKNDALPHTLASMIEAIEQTPDFAGKFLSKIKVDAWGPMNGYTHGGIHPISRRTQGAYIEANFDEGEVLEVIQFAGTMATIALNRIAAMARDKELEKETNAKTAPPPANAI